MGELEAEMLSLADYKTRSEAGIAQVVQDDTLSPADTYAAILSIVAAGTAPEEERKQAEIRKQIADLEKQLAV